MAGHNASHGGGDRVSVASHIESRFVERGFKNNASRLELSLARGFQTAFTGGAPGLEAKRSGERVSGELEPEMAPPVQLRNKAPPGPALSGVPELFRWV